MKMLITIVLMAVVGTLAIWRNHNSIDPFSLYCAGISALIIIALYLPYRRFFNFIRRLTLTNRHQRSRQK